MRISHKYKFVFLAIPRTGSTTVRNILDDYSDIKSKHINQITKEFPFYHHISALELKEVFDKVGWNWSEYKKFCVVRNPFDRTVSLYHHFTKMREEENSKKQTFKMLLRKMKYTWKPINNFEDFVLQINPRKRLNASSLSFISDKNGNKLVDDILKFEELQTSFPKYLSKFGIKIEAADIPHLNASKSRQSYEKYYNEKTKKRVFGLYKSDIESFGYIF